MASTQELTDVFLQPGELFVGDASYAIRTILGSCVSITLWHPHQRIGGMSHFLLPTRGLAVPEAAMDGRYGDEALALMCRDLRAAGVDPLACQAKVFGGGNMFPGNQHARGKQDKAIHVGMRNGEAAQTLLRQHGISVVGESLFGMGHRQVVFEVCSGHVWSRQVRPSLYEVATESAGQGV